MWIKLLMLFGVDYVILLHYDGERMIKQVTNIDGKYYASPYICTTTAELLPDGVAKGVSFIDGWEPVSKRMYKHYGKTITDEINALELYVNQEREETK